jgi:hypothetical protein
VTYEDLASIERRANDQRCFYYTPVGHGFVNRGRNRDVELVNSIRTSAIFARKKRVCDRLSVHFCVS